MIRIVFFLFVLSGSVFAQTTAQQPEPAASQPQEEHAKPDMQARIGGPVKPPVLKHMVDPVYSKPMKRADFKGNIQVYVIVEADGTLSKVHVTRGYNADFDQAALDAVRQYKFKPATQGGKPVKVDLYIEVNFGGW